MKVQKSNNTGVDKSVDELNILIQSRLQQRVNKPLVTSPTKPISESTKINEIIKDPTTIVDTGKPLDDNKIIDDFDKVSESDVIDILKPNTIKPLDIPIPFEIKTNWISETNVECSLKSKNVEGWMMKGGMSYNRHSEMKLSVERHFKKNWN